MSTAFPGSAKTASSAAVESNFNILKNRIFQNDILPLKIDEFVVKHLRSIEGNMKLLEAEDRDVDSGRRETTENVITSKAVGDAPIQKEVAVTDSEEQTEEEEAAAHNPEDVQIAEFQEVENWGGQLTAIKKRKRSSYLEKNREWLHIDLQQKANVVPIGILRNGNCSNLKPIRSGKKRIVLNNTCAFDSVIQILCAAFCDSDGFKEYILLLESEIKNLITQVIKQINTKAYNIRYRILKNIFPGDYLPNNLVLISTECTTEQLVRQLCAIGELEHTYTETIQCRHCEHLREIRLPVLPITCKNVYNLQQEIIAHINSHEKSTPCVNCTSPTIHENRLHTKIIFIEILDTSLSIPELQLKYIPRQVVVENQIYVLRGTISYFGSYTNESSLSSVGHFKAYCCRLNGKWEEYDELHTKKMDLNEATLV